jgi:RNA-directed DNA polymerase
VLNFCISGILISLILDSENMAKTFKNLYEQVASFENLWLAYRKARRGKRYGVPAASFDRHAEESVMQIQKELISGCWTPGNYRNFYIYEPKKRLISAAPFRDRIVHHAVVNILEPIWEARFSEASFACRKGKGTHAAVERAHWGVRNCRYYLKGDVVKFFPSVDHDVLMGLLARKIADDQLLLLIRRILESGCDIHTDDGLAAYFPGDDLFSPHSRKRGLPIGNLTSQFFANVLLNELDQFVHGVVKPRQYVRYSDDFVLFDHDKEKLLEARCLSIEKLAELRLRGHPRKTAMRASSMGLKFLGFKLTPKTRRLNPESIHRFRNRMKTYRASRRHGDGPDLERVGMSVRGWIAHAKHANTSAMLKGVLRDVAV